MTGKTTRLASENNSDEGSSSDKLFFLDGNAAHKAAGRSRVTRSMSAPVLDLKAQASKKLNSLLQSLFDSVDDALFDLAEGAASNQQQNNFFESMREVRFKRVDIERRFLDGLQEDFVRLFSVGDAANPESRAGVQNDDLEAESGESLSLMEDDLVEEMVAVDAMVSRYEKLLATLLDALNARLAELAQVSVDDLEEGRRQNPLAPRQLCNNFSEASRILNIDIKARIVIFKLYEKVVLSQLPEIYKHANEKLIRAGVLPNYSGRKRSASRRDNVNSAIPGQQGGTQVLTRPGGRPVHTQQAQEFTQLLNAMPDYEGGLNLLWADAGAGQPGAPGLPISLSSAIQTLASSVGPVIGGPGLISLLDTMQRHSAAQFTLGSLQSGELPPLLNPDNVLASIHSGLVSASVSGQYSLGRTEREVITMVALLFHFVLEDKDVAEPLRRVISRLQIPIIKLALQDANFFCSGAHPARRLLNELTRASIGWVECDDYHKDPLYKTVCAIVDRVMDEFENDQQLFAELLADLKSMLAGEDRRAELRRKRLVDAEVGKDASEQARKRVDEVLTEKMGESGLPDEVREPLVSTWSNVLFLAYLQQGEDSEEWNAAVKALNTLMWTISPKRNKQDRAGILKELPGLLKTLRQGFDRVNCSKQQSAAFFTGLEKLHMSVMQRDDSLGQAAASAEETAATPTERVEPRQPVAQSAASQGADTTSHAVEDVEPTEGDVDVVAGEHLERAGQLAVGQWIELRDGKAKKRCRLVAILRNNGKRIFVDRSGGKACEFGVQEIAQRIKAGSIVLLEDAQFFDRALSSIISGLRKQKNTVLDD